MIFNEPDVERYERMASEFVSCANLASKKFPYVVSITNMYEELATESLSLANRLRLEALN